MVQEEDALDGRRHDGDRARPRSGIGVCQGEPGGRGREHGSCAGEQKERDGKHAERERGGEERQRCGRVEYGPGPY